MASKWSAMVVIVWCAVVAVTAAAPQQVWYSTADNVYPGVLLYREGRAPSIAYGFGSGFSSEIAGVRQSTALGASFNTGGGHASGEGLASADGAVHASGAAGIARAPYPLRHSYTYNYAAPPPPLYAPPAVHRYVAAPGYHSALGQNSGATASALQNNRYQSVPSAPAHGYNQGGAAAAANTGYNTASSSSSGYGGTAVSSAQSRDANGDLNLAVSAAESAGEYRASTAQAVQRRGGAVQQTGATSVEGPGIQAAHTHAIRTGYY